MNTPTSTAATVAATPVKAQRPAKAKRGAQAPAPAKPQRTRASAAKPLAQQAAPAQKALPAPSRLKAKPKAVKSGSSVASVPLKAVPTPGPEAPAKEHTKARAKLVRDSFTMPQPDFDLIDVLKERALGFKRPTKKSELLRAGLQVLAALRSDQLKQVLGRLVPLKTGRPKKAS